MRTAFLHRRFAVGSVVVAAVLAVAGGSLYLASRAQTERGSDAIIATRAETVRRAGMTASGEVLAGQLRSLGLTVDIRMPDGTVFEGAPRTTPSPGGRGGLAGGDGTVSMDVQLADGSTATVFAPLAPARRDPTRVLVLELLGILFAAVVASMLLFNSWRRALRPVEEITASERRTAQGLRGHQVQPDRPGTVLGDLAVGQNDMVEALERSERRANETQLEAESLYLNLRQVIETANEAFIAMDAMGAITDWSSRAEHLFGWTRREAVGRSLADTIVPPDVRAAHTSGLERFARTGESKVLGRSVEFDAVHRDGRRIPVEISAWVTYLGEEPTFNALLRDVSEQRMGAEALARLASIVESAQEAITSTSLDGTIVSWNYGAERLYGYAAAEAIGRPASCIIPASCQGELEEISEAIASGKSVARRETARRRKNGEEVEVAITCAPIFDAWGSVVGASTIARDITDQRQVARELDETLAALELALEEARGAEERTRRFLADAAHQLRSPIAGLRACAETVLRGAPEGDGDRLLAEIVRETSRTGKLIAALLRLARLDQDAPRERADCDLVRVCESEADRIRALAPHLTVRVETSQVATPLPDVDENSVAEILTNLLDNARRHARHEILISASSDASMLYVEVVDDGSGIPEQAVGQVFDRFVSLDGKGGSGLGLAIARSLARADGGDLTYSDGATAGAVFLLSLPIAVQAVEEASVARA